jgi:hypothetical protein
MNKGFVEKGNICLERLRRKIQEDKRSRERGILGRWELGYSSVVEHVLSICETLVQP